MGVHMLLKLWKENYRVDPYIFFWLFRMLSYFQKWPEAEFHIVPDAGHSAKEPGIFSRLLDATDKYKCL